MKIELVWIKFGLSHTYFKAEEEIYFVKNIILWFGVEDVIFSVKTQGIFLIYNLNQLFKTETE